MSPGAEWTITITVRADSPTQIEWLRRALSPEIAREVPRASAALTAPGVGQLRVTVEARDTSAARAATNTYLGWIHLAWETARRAQAAAHGPSTA